MANHCMFTVIQGDSSQRLGDRGATVWEKAFDAPERDRDGSAVLMFMVRGLTATESDVDVKINDTKVGVIENYNGADPNHWFTQIINIGSGILERRDNQLQIEAITYPHSTAGDVYDDFWIRDVVCFYKD